MAASTSIVVYDPRHADPKVVALAGFLAGYSGRTREAYTLDLRQFFAWCEQRGVQLFDVHRSEIELFARELEESGRARATIGRRLNHRGLLPVRRRGRTHRALSSRARAPPPP